MDWRKSRCRDISINEVDQALALFTTAPGQTLKTGASAWRLGYRPIRAGLPKHTLGWRGRKSNDEDIEVLQHLPTEVVDRPVAFVADDEIECLDSNGGVVSHRDRLLAQRPRLKQGRLFVLRVKFGLNLLEYRRNMIYSEAPLDWFEMFPRGAVGIVLDRRACQRNGRLS